MLVNVVDIGAEYLLTPHLLHPTESCTSIFIICGREFFEVHGIGCRDVLERHSHGSLKPELYEIRAAIGVGGRMELMAGLSQYAVVLASTASSAPGVRCQQCKSQPSTKHHEAKTFGTVETTASDIRPPDEHGVAQASGELLIRSISHVSNSCQHYRIYEHPRRTEGHSPFGKEPEGFVDHQRKLA